MERAIVVDSGNIEIARRSSLLMPLLRIARQQDATAGLTVGALFQGLQDRSFGWAIMVFSLITLLPLPPGSSLITALPVLVTTAQFALGYRRLHLPRRLERQRIDSRKFRRSIIRVRPVARRLEGILRPRLTSLYTRGNEQLLGVALFLTAFALFLPVPFSGWFPAIALFVSGVGLVERDGVVSLAGLILGLLSVALTIALLLSFAAGAEVLIEQGG